jgi:hypothetical protein
MPGGGSDRGGAIGMFGFTICDSLTYILFAAGSSSEIIVGCVCAIIIKGGGGANIGR